MGYLNSYSHAGFLTFLICFSVLFVLFIIALREGLYHHKRETAFLVLFFGALFALTGIFVYPVNAIDMYGYIAESAEFIHYHANPLVTAAIQYANDPLIHVANSFVSSPAPYGPLGILIDAIPTLFSGSNLLANMLLLKGFFSIFLLFEAYMVYKIVSYYHPEYAIASMLAFVWNPYVILELVVNSHNDVIMIFFVLLAVYLCTKEHYSLAFACILLSALVKYSSFPLVPLFIFYSLFKEKSISSRLKYILKILLVTIGVTLFVVLPFWTGPQILTSVSDLTQARLYSLTMFLSDAFPDMSNIQVPGYILFALSYVCALWIVIRKRNGLILACFITMLALLAFAVNYIQVWYLVWPMLLALLLPRKRMYGVMILLAYAGTVVELVHAYIWPWGAYQNASSYAIVNSVVYLVLFWPSLFLLIIFAINDIRVKYGRNA